MLPLSVICDRLSKRCGFDIYVGKKFQLEGSQYRILAADIDALALLARLHAARPWPPNVYWLLPFRDLLRRPSAGMIFAYAAQQCRYPQLRCLAIWLRGRRGGKIGMHTMAALYRGGDATLRKEVTRALKRMQAWSELRRIQACDPEPRIRRLARQKPPQPYRTRMTQFMQQVTPCQSLPAHIPFFEQSHLEIQEPNPPKSPSFIRSILERIRALVQREHRTAAAKS